MSGPLRWPAPAQPAPAEPAEPVLLTRRTYGALELFLFSAAGWHPHRIHFDQAYATEVEGHAALVVHGPFQAVHLVDDLVGGLDVPVWVRTVSYRHLALLSAGQEALVKARLLEVAEDGRQATFEVWMERADDGQRTTAATATLERLPDGPATTSQDTDTGGPR